MCTRLHAHINAQPAHMQCLHLRTCTTHLALLIHVRTLLDELRNIFGHVVLHRSNERVLAAMLAQHGLHFFV